MSKLKHFAILGGLLFSATCFSISASAQSLQSTIDAAIASEPNLAAIRANTEIQEAHLYGARAANKSSLGLSGSYGASNADFGGGYQAIYPRALMLAWEKRIFDGGAALSRIEASEFALAARNGQYLNARNNLIVETVEAYLNLHTAFQGSNYANDAFSAAQRMARDAGLQFNAGEVAIDEKAQAEAALHRAEAAKLVANGQIKIAAANLYRLSGIIFNESNIKTELDVKPLNIPATEAVAKEIAKENHPILASARAQVAANEANLRIANSARMPIVSVSARANTVRDQFLAGYKADDVGAYVNFSMPLWDNGRTSSEQQSARANLAAGRANLRAAERNIEMSITNAYVNYEVQKSSLVAAKASLDATEVVFKSIEAQMRVGERPISDLLDARAKLTAAQIEHLKASSSLILARYKIMQAIGAELQ